MRRGEIWWADLPRPMGRRPVLILTRDAACEVRSYVTVAPLTTTIRKIRSEVVLGPADGLPRKCVVNLDDMQTVKKIHLKEFLTRVSGEKMVQVKEAIEYALDLRG
jgi:mRNA interferase MazF